MHPKITVSAGEGNDHPVEVQSPSLVSALLWRIAIIPSRYSKVLTPPHARCHHAAGRRRCQRLPSDQARER